MDSHSHSAVCVRTTRLKSESTLKMQDTNEVDTERLLCVCTHTSCLQCWFAWRLYTARYTRCCHKSVHWAFALHVCSVGSDRAFELRVHTSDSHRFILTACTSCLHWSLAHDITLLVHTSRLHCAFTRQVCGVGSNRALKLSMHTSDSHIKFTLTVCTSGLHWSFAHDISTACAHITFTLCVYTASLRCGFEQSA